MANTTEFIIALRERINEILPTYYEEAPKKDAVFPFGVLNGLHITELAAGDLALFYIDIWTDEKKTNATEELEMLCDRVRNELVNGVIAELGVFAAHIGFENQSIESDKEYDIAHRRLALSARIFYNK